MTERQAYAAMYAFLEGLWENTKSDQIAALLGSLSLLTDGTPADSALEEDWTEAVRRAKAGEVDLQLHLNECD